MSLHMPQPSANGNLPNILLVEDDHATRRLYSHLLSISGYNVIEAEDGMVALEQLAKHECRLVVTDLNMPRMDGLELIAQIRSKYPDTYVILMTAYGTLETKKRAQNIGANDYLEKPFEFEDLETRIKSVLQARSATA